MSSSTSPAKSRLNHVGGPFKLLDGTVIANDWAGLTSGTILAPIDVDQTGTKVTSEEIVWTGTTPSGDVTVGATCDDWDPGDAATYNILMVAGRTDVKTAQWTEIFFTDGATYSGACGGETYLYCFEQP
jgi:hypothetical protein